MAYNKAGLRVMRVINDLTKLPQFISYLASVIILQRKEKLNWLMEKIEIKMANTVGTIKRQSDTITKTTIAQDGSITFFLSYMWNNILDKTSKSYHYIA